MLGPVFDLAPVVAVAGIAPRDAAEALDEASAAGLVVRASAAPPTWRFAHGLVRETLYDDLPAAVRMTLHAQAAAALEGQTDEHAVHAVAHHWLAAGPVGDAAKAVEWALQAGTASLRQLAYEDAAAAYADALSVARWSDAMSAETRVRALEGLGRAKLLAGAVEGALEAFDRASAAAPDPVSRARVLVAWADAQGRGAGEPGVAVTRLADALQNTDLPADLLARLQLALAQAHLESARIGSADADAANAAARAAFERATAAAREADDRGLQAHVLAARASWAGEHDHERVAVAQALLAFATEHADVERQFNALSLGFAAQLETGAIDAARRTAARFSDLADASRQPFRRALALEHAFVLALVEGRLSDAERLLALREAVPVLPARSSGLRFELRWHQDAIDDTLTAEVGSTAQLFVLAERGLGLVDSGRREEASELLHTALDDPFLEVRGSRPHPWTATVAQLARLTAAVGDAQAAQRLAPLLAPLSGRWVAYGALLCLGPVDHHLGVLAAVGERWDDAVAAQAAAAAQARRAGAPLWAAYAHHAHASALFARNRGDDRRAGESAAAQASELAQRLSLPRVRRLVSDLHLAGATHSSADATPARPDHGRISRQEAGWQLEFAGQTVMVGERKGMHHLAVLLRQPGVPIPAVVLEALHADRRAGLRATLAKASGRLADLRADVEDAERSGEAERAARARELLDVAASGVAELFGPVDDSVAVERARQVTYKAISAAISAVARHHEMLGRHLSASVRTGTTCVYEPERRVVWEISAEAAKR